MLQISIMMSLPMYSLFGQAGSETRAKFLLPYYGTMETAPSLMLRFKPEFILNVQPTAQPGPTLISMAGSIFLSLMNRFRNKDLLLLFLHSFITMNVMG